MSIGTIHVMSSNQRLLNQIERDIFHDAANAWVKVYSQFCKKQGELMPNRVMQFKYKGEQYKLTDDVLVRSGVKPLHVSLEAEFKDAHKMFVEEVEHEKRILKNMMAHAIRIAKYAEDLLDILPEIMHDSVHESGFFQMDYKQEMTVDQVAEFKELYGPYFNLFDMRKTVGSLM